MADARSRGRSCLVGALVASLTLVAFSLIPAKASAVNWVYCIDSNLPGYGHCDGPRHTLVSNRVSDGGYGPHTVCAGALDGYTGAFTGSYTCGTSLAIQYYCACYLYYPRAHNGESFATYVSGTEYY